MRQPHGEPKTTAKTGERGDDTATTRPVSTLNILTAHLAPANSMSRDCVKVKKVLWQVELDNGRAQDILNNKCAEIFLDSERQMEST